MAQETPGDATARRVGAWIVRARKLRGLTQQRLAGRVPITPGQLSRIERGMVGTSGPHPSTLRGIEEALEVPEGTLRRVASGDDVPAEPGGSAGEVTLVQVLGLVEDLADRLDDLSDEVARLRHGRRDP